MHPSQRCGACRHQRQRAQGNSGLRERRRRRATEAVTEHVEFVDSARAHRRRTGERDVLRRSRSRNCSRNLQASGVAQSIMSTFEPTADQASTKLLPGVRSSTLQQRHETHDEQWGSKTWVPGCKCQLELDLVASPHHVLGRAPDRRPPDAGGRVLQPVASTQRVPRSTSSRIRWSKIGRRWHRGRLGGPRHFAAGRSASVARRERGQVLHCSHDGWEQCGTFWPTHKLRRCARAGMADLPCRFEQVQLRRGAYLVPRRCRARCGPVGRAPPAFTGSLWAISFIAGLSRSSSASNTFFHNGDDVSAMVPPGTRRSAPAGRRPPRGGGWERCPFSAAWRRAVILARANFQLFEAARPAGSVVAGDGAVGGPLCLGVVAAATAPFPIGSAITTTTAASRMPSCAMGRSGSPGACPHTGVGEGSRVGGLCRNHHGFVEWLVAASATGADVVLLNTRVRRRLTRGGGADAEGITAIVHDDEFADIVGEAGVETYDESAWQTLADFGDAGHASPGAGANGDPHVGDDRTAERCGSTQRLRCDRGRCCRVRAHPVPAW